MEAGNFDRIGVVGGGLMGSGIAEVCARAGLDVVVVESRRGRGRPARRIEKSLRGPSKGQVRRPGRCGLGRIVVDTEKMLADRELVVEAIVEDEQAKVALFAARRDRHVPRRDPRLQHLVDPDHEARRRDEAPEHVLGIHFFNPVPVLSLVELVPAC